jgi:hypothetical protein
MIAFVLQLVIVGLIAFVALGAVLGAYLLIKESK